MPVAVPVALPLTVTTPIPSVTVDPTGNPPSGYVFVWFRSDLAALSVRNSGGTVLRTGALT